MTDAEIIKALECCAGDDGCCDVCPMYKPSSECITELQGKALDLINRQKAEIESLRKAILDADYSSITALKAKQNWYIENSEYIRKLNEENDKLKDMYYSMQSTLTKMSMGVEEAKAEAIKELMFNLDNEISTYSSAGKDLNVYAWLKSYVKEMVGDME